MRGLPGTSVKELLQVSIAPSIGFMVQLAYAAVDEPPANTSEDSVPVAPVALFQCVASFTPAASLASITTVPDGAAAPLGLPPTKSMLRILDKGAPPASAPSAASTRE